MIRPTIIWLTGQSRLSRCLGHSGKRTKLNTTVVSTDGMTIGDDILILEGILCCLIGRSDHAAISNAITYPIRSRTILQTTQHTVAERLIFFRR